MIRSIYSKLKAFPSSFKEFQNNLNKFSSSLEATQDNLNKFSSSLEETQNNLNKFSSSLEETQNNLNKFSSSFEESQKTLILGLTQSIFKHLTGMSNNRAKQSSTSFIEASSDLYALWSEVNINLNHWNECELILACPLTIRGALQLFADKEVIEIKDFSSLRNFFVTLRSKRYQSIGIVTPEILKYLFEDQTLLIHLLQVCQRQVVFLTGKNDASMREKLYLFLHKVGFYEILFINDEGKICCSTVGHMANDSFDMRSSMPGFPLNKNWATHIASRMAMPKVNDLSWWAAFGFLEFTEKGTSAAPEQLGLSVNVLANPGKSMNAQLIKGVIRWTKCNEGLSTGHASLVGCYAGPGDTNMYAAIVEVLSDTIVSISIWRNDGNWVCLQKTTTSIENSPQDKQGNFSLALWLKITDSLIIVGTEDKTLLSLNDNKLQRIPTVGVRIFNSYMSISDLTANFVKE